MLCPFWCGSTRTNILAKEWNLTVGISVAFSNSGHLFAGGTSVNYEATNHERNYTGSSSS